MNYEEFKENLLIEVQKVYGGDVEVRTDRVLKNNGQSYEGLKITKNIMERTIPFINMDIIYQRYRMGGMDMKKCVGEVCRFRDENECSDSVLEFAKRLADWEFVKGNVYPMLLSTEKNRELLQQLASTPFLDLSVVYMIRGKIPGSEGCSVKINKAMLGEYGISREELHEQAVENMKKDGYRFCSMESLVKDLLRSNGCSLEETHEEELEKQGMYALTNSERVYGAAGILDTKLIGEFAVGRSFFIIPSSIHETIFVPAYEGFDREWLDEIIVETNETAVDMEERLSNHSYYYDGVTGEIRMDK